MRDGTFTFYTYQHIKILETDWSKPDSELKPVQNPNYWSFSSWDHFGHAIDPWNPKKYGHKLYKEFSNESRDCLAKTDSYGLWTLEQAQSGLLRLRDANDKGEFDCLDNRCNKCQGLRYLFRIVKVTASQQVEVVQGQAE